MSRSLAIADSDANTDRLTPKQAAFVMGFTSEAGSIGNASEAARRAGYSEKSAAEIGRQLLGKQHVRAAIEAANRDRVSSEILVEATEVLVGIMRDIQNPAKVRAHCAIALMDRAGHGPPTASERKADADARQRDANGRLYSDYSADELDAAIARILAEQHQGPDNAKVIDGSAVEANDG